MCAAVIPFVLGVGDAGGAPARDLPVHCPVCFDASGVGSSRAVQVQCCCCCMSMTVPVSPRLLWLLWGRGVDRAGIL